MVEGAVAAVVVGEVGEVKPDVEVGGVKADTNRAPMQLQVIPLIRRPAAAPQEL